MSRNHSTDNLEMETIRVGSDQVPEYKSELKMRDVPVDVPERSTASPELVKPPASTRRPVLHRFYSTPDHLSPGRQKYRLNNKERRPVKETSAVNETETEVGKRINQYQFIEAIGHGRYGKIGLAQDTSSGAYVAIKQLSKANIVKANRKKLMQLRRHNKMAKATDLIGKEVAIMKKIDHPNLVELIEVLDDESSDSLYMIIEWCEHGPLTLHGTLDEKQCRLYFRDMVLAVEYLHAHGITHRDIKAENVLLGSGDVLKLADFGVSEVLESNEDQDTVQSCVGSPAYYAPELANLAHVGMNADDLTVVSGRKTDIWAMGVTLYHMYHGHLPFQTETLGDLYTEICQKEPTFGDEISPEFRDILKRLMTKDTNNRITIAELREHPWLTKDGKDPLLSIKENTCSSGATITDEDLQNAIERAENKLNRPVDASKVTSSLQESHGWRGTSGEVTPATPEGQATASLNVNKLVRALEEMAELEKWK